MFTNQLQIRNHEIIITTSDRLYRCVWNAATATDNQEYMCLMVTNLIDVTVITTFGQMILPRFAKFNLIHQDEW